MLRVLRDLLRYDGRFRLAVVLLSGVVIMILLSFNSPDPKTLKCHGIYPHHGNTLLAQHPGDRTSSGG